MRGFVFDLNRFSQHDLKGGFEWVVSCLPCVPRNGGVFTWLDAARFVEEWTRLKLLGVPPENFENEREAIERLQTVIKAARVRVDLARRLGNSGVSLRQIANVAGLIESDVRRIAEGLQEPSDRVALLIWSTLDSLSGERVPTTPNPTDVVSEDQP